MRYIKLINSGIDQSIYFTYSKAVQGAKCGLKTVYHNSIFCLFHKSAFKESMKEIPNARRLPEGIKIAVCAFAPALATMIISYKIFHELGFPDHEPSDTTVAEAVILGPFLEEMIFRIIGQNGVRLAQFGVQKLCPSRWDKTIVMRAITSQKTRIVIISAIFATVHLTNAPFLAAGTLALLTAIVIFPTSTMAYERGGFEASWMAHMTHNLLCSVL